MARSKKMMRSALSLTISMWVGMPLAGPLYRFICFLLGLNAPATAAYGEQLGALVLNVAVLRFGDAVLGQHTIGYVCVG